MKTKIFFTLTVMLAGSFLLTAQVQVSNEPRHKKVLENKYIRLLDVWLQPGDTTQYHIHSTPSVFLHFSNAIISSQVKEKDWITEQTVPGKTYYRSFSPDSLIHRVCNPGHVPFHVTDVEILSSFKPAAALQALPLTILYENEKVFAYKVSDSSFPPKTISDRGPMIAELISGSGIYFVDNATKKETEIKPGGWHYIDPGATFYFSNKGKEKVNMVLFEIK